MRFGSRASSSVTSSSADLLVRGDDLEYNNLVGVFKHLAEYGHGSDGVTFELVFIDFVYLGLALFIGLGTYGLEKPATQPMW